MYYCVERVGGSVFTISAYDDQAWEQKSSTIVYGYDFYAHDMTYDPVDKKIYGNFMKVDEEGESRGFVWGWLDVENLQRVAIADMDRSLAAVAATTGASQAVGTLDEYQQLRGMFFPRPLASDNAPAAVTGINPMFSGDALLGMTVITMPNKTYAGDDMSGQLSYTVYVNGEQYSTGTSWRVDMKYDGQTAF